jgi:N-formylglutamate deformylase
MLQEPYYFHTGSEPLVAAAIHSGHRVRNDLKKLFNLSESERLREEDPHTDWLASVAPSYIVAHQSRFEVDLNRDRNHAVYRTPEDAWGLKVWNDTPDEGEIEKSLAIYDSFYSTAKDYLSAIINKYGYVIVYDLHTYNHRRGGPYAPPADPAENPDINLGTANLNRKVWGPVVDALTEDLRSFDYPAGPLDVRENIKFRGGHFSRWMRGEFGDQCCAIAIEFKKIFMDEWTHEHDQGRLTALYNALKITVPQVMELSREIAGNYAGDLK